MWLPAFLFAVVFLASAHGLRNKTLIAYLGTTPVLDGRIDPAEWADADSESGILDWDPEFEPVVPSKPVDLDLTLWVKHDKTHLYFAFQVTDDVLYAFQTPPWLPTGNPEANNLTQQVHCVAEEKRSISPRHPMHTFTGRGGRGLGMKWSSCSTQAISRGTRIRPSRATLLRGRW